MLVVMGVGIDGEGFSGLGAEQAFIFGMFGDGFRHARTAHMVVQAHNPVACAEHHVQIVRDEQNAAAPRVPDCFNQRIKFRLAGEVDILHRFIQHQQLRVAHQRLGQRDSLEFTA